MEGQDLGVLITGEPSLLRRVELIVIDAHRRMYEEDGKPWSEPVAYHWLRYEDPMPVARLADGAHRLLRSRVKVDGEAVQKACAEARKLGFPN
jgi:hypothetical protein